jgi:hypothetical protein
MSRKKPAKKKAASKKKSASRKKSAAKIARRTPLKKKAARKAAARPRKPKPKPKPKPKAKARRAPVRLARAAAPEAMAAETEPDTVPDAVAAAPAATPLETFDAVNRELVSVPAGFAEAGTVPIRLDWSGLAMGDAIAAGDVIGHWIWQTGRTEIRGPAGCAGTVLDLRVPECDILDQPPSQVLLVLAP